jgi:hypothetical protein
VHDEVLGPLLVEGDLDLEARLLLDVLLGELDDVSHARRVQPGRGARLELLHRPQAVQLRHLDAQLLAEELAELPGDEAVVHPDRAGLGAAPAQRAAVRQLGQVDQQVPVDVDVVSPQLRKDAAAGLEVPVDDPAQDLAAEGGPVHLGPPGVCVDPAGVVAGLALDAVLQRQHQGLEERPVVLLVQELGETGQELRDLLFLLLLGGGLRDLERAHPVGPGLEALALLVAQGGDRGVLPVLVGEGKGHQLVDVEALVSFHDVDDVVGRLVRLRQGLGPAPGRLVLTHLGCSLLLFHAHSPAVVSSGSVVATSAHVFPVRVCAADQSTPKFKASRSRRSRRLPASRGRSSQRTSW